MGKPTALTTLTVGGVPIIGAGLGGIPWNGPAYFVNESVGLDGNSGASNSPLQTLDRALALESAATGGAGGRNAVVYFWGTQHRTTTLAWNLPSTHLIGICSPMKRGKRARISVTGSTGFNKLVENSAQGNFFANFGTFYGWANSSAALINWSDIGGHSTYENVEFMGFGDGTVSTGSANLTGSRAFSFNTNVGETTWRDCVFGVDTEVRNAANFTLEIAGGAPRLTFENCDFEADLGSSGGGASHVLIDVDGIDRYAIFNRCRFLNAEYGGPGATAMAQCFNAGASTGGTLVIDQCMAAGITAWQTTPTAAYQNMVAPSSGGGIAAQVPG